MRVYRIQKGLFSEDWAVIAEQRRNKIKFTAFVTLRIGRLIVKTKTIKGLLPCIDRAIDSKYVRVVGVIDNQIQDVTTPRTKVRGFSVHLAR